MKNRILATLLAILMIAAALTSCGTPKTPDTPGTSGTPASASQPADTTAAPEPESPLGFKKEDNGGREFWILNSQRGAYEYAVEESSGEIVSDSVYERNMTVEDYLGIRFKYKTVSHDLSDAAYAGNAINDEVKALAAAGDNTYDMVASVTIITMGIVADGYFRNILDMDINLDNPWWVAGQKDELSINGRLYGILGDLSLSLYKDMNVIYFNKTLLDANHLTNPYELVRSGKWTLDTFIELAQQGDADLDGDGVMSPEKDQFQCVGQKVPNRSFLTSSGIRLIQRDGDKITFLPLPEELANVADKLYAFFSSDKTYVHNPGTHEIYFGYFNEGRSLFMNTFLYAADYLRDMKDDYGIVPYPKYDEAQKQYITQTGTSTTMNFFPLNLKDPALSAKTVEALAYYGKIGTVPAYYETTLKTKYASDKDVQEMLDIIRDGATMSFLFAYGASFKSFNAARILDFTPGDKSYEKFASTYASRLTGWTTDLENLIAAFSK